MPIDTLVIIGNGFDRWLGLPTSYQDYRYFYHANHKELLRVSRAKTHVLIDQDKQARIEIDDAELLYSDPVDYIEPKDSTSNCIFDNWFWNDFENNLGLINALHINGFFGKNRSDLRDLDRCAKAAKRLISQSFSRWAQSLDAGLDNLQARSKPINNCFFINFNYTHTLERVYRVPENRIFHIHGDASNRKSIIFGHSLHPWNPDSFMKKMGGRLKGLYHLLKIWNATDKQVEDNLRLLRLVFALNEIDMSKIKHIYILGHSLGEADLGYFRYFGCRNQPELIHPYIEDSLPQFNGFDDRMLRIQYEIERFGNGLSENQIDPILISAINRYQYFDQENRELEVRDYFKSRMSDAEKARFAKSAKPNPNDDTVWHISCHSPQSKERAFDVLKLLGVSSFELVDTIDDLIVNIMQ